MLLQFKRFEPIYQIKVLQLHNLPFLSLYLLHATLSDLWDTYQSGSDHMHLATVPWSFHYQELAFPAQINECHCGTSAILRNGFTIMSPKQIASRVVECFIAWSQLHKGIFFVMDLEWVNVVCSRGDTCVCNRHTQYFGWTFTSFEALSKGTAIASYSCNTTHCT